MNAVMRGHASDDTIPSSADTPADPTLDALTARPTRVCALLTCFNRRDKTLACLRALQASSGLEQVTLHAVLVDDGSTDGTAEAVKAEFHWVEVQASGGDLFWCRGMHQAFGAALARDFDHYLWLNDDTQLMPDALAGMLSCAAELRLHRTAPVIVVGSTVDPRTDQLSYGGERQPSRLRRARVEPVMPQERAQTLDTLNGNVVLIPRLAAQRVGNLDPIYEHAMGDTDYGFRARHLGVELWLAPRIQGHCAVNPKRGTYLDDRLPLLARWRRMLDRKGLPWRSWLVYTRRHMGVAWPLYFLWPYAKLLITGLGADLHRLIIRRTQGIGEATHGRVDSPHDFPVDSMLIAGPAKVPLRVAIVTNIPAPYRLPIYELLAATPGIALKVFFCSAGEPDREWDLGSPRVDHEFLRERVFNWHGRFIHANPDVWLRLREFGPDVVVTTGFNPTHLLAFAFARWQNAKHVPMTDGTAMSEAGLSFVHRRLRRWVYQASSAFVGASAGSMALYRQYGVPESAMFQSHLCANNGAFAVGAQVQRDFDFIFCGRFVARKLPEFVVAVAAATAKRLRRRTRLLLVGSGQLEEKLRQAAAAASDCVDAHFTGFARQAELPGHYARARIALFPTLGDTWGVVANEACAAGLPVLVSPQAGVAGDLVRDEENGHVLTLDVNVWAQAAAELLSDEARWLRMSARSFELVRPYTYANSARGLAAAVALAVAGTKQRQEDLAI